MAVRGAQRDEETAAELPDVVPVDLTYLSRLSWELGSRIVGDEESTLLEEWEHASAGWTLSTFAVTSTTVVIRLCTPVGRERFYGAVQSEVASASEDLAAAPSWQRAE